MGSSEVTVNVGGVLYTTSISTLTKYRDSTLCDMFSGDAVNVARDKKGYFFIDRDGQLFRIILNFLRDTSSRLLLPEQFTEYRQLKAEADFYKIQPLQDELAKLANSASKTNKHFTFYVELKCLEMTGADRYFYIHLRGPYFSPDSTEIKALLKSPIIVKLLHLHDQIQNRIMSELKSPKYQASGNHFEIVDWKSKYYQSDLSTSFNLKGWRPKQLEREDIVGILLALGGKPTSSLGGPSSDVLLFKHWCFDVEINC